MAGRSPRPEPEATVVPVTTRSFTRRYGPRQREDDDYAAQLMRLGLIPGTEIRVQRRAPLGDPMEIRFRGFSLALRPSEADALMLELI